MTGFRIQNIVYGFEIRLITDHFSISTPLADRHTQQGILKLYFMLARNNFVAFSIIQHLFVAHKRPIVPSTICVSVHL